MTTSSALYIDQIMEETPQTLFTNRIANACHRDTGKIKFQEFSGRSDPKVCVLAFRLAIAQAHLNDKEKEVFTVGFFVENITRPALECFAGLEGNTIDNFTQLATNFLKHYSVFIEKKFRKEPFSSNTWENKKLQS